MLALIKYRRFQKSVNDLEKKIPDQAKVAELKAQHDVDLDAAWAKIHRVTERRHQIVADALHRKKTEVDTSSRAIAARLGLEYMSLDYADEEEKRLRDVCFGKMRDIKIPLIIQAHATLRPNQDLRYLIQHQYLPLLSITHLFQRLQDEELGIIWLEGFNLKAHYLQTDHEPLKKLISETRFSEITSHAFSQKIKNLGSDEIDPVFKEHAFATIRQYNQALLAHYDLQDYRVIGMELSSAWVNDVFHSYPLDKITQQHTAIYEEEKRQADRAHDDEIDPFCDEIGQIESKYVAILQALLPKHEVTAEEKKAIVCQTEKQAKNIALEAMAFAIEKTAHPTLPQKEASAALPPSKPRTEVSVSTATPPLLKPVPVLFKPINLIRPIDHDYLTLIFSLDYDGCTHTPQGQSAVIEYIVTQVLENPQCQNVILCSASLRQSLSIELLNAIQKQYKNHKRSQWISSAEELQNITTNVYLRLKEAYQKLGKTAPTVALNPIHTFDVYHQLPAHTTHKAMTAEHYQRLFEASKVNNVKVWRDNEQGRPVCLLFWPKHGKMFSRFPSTLEFQDPYKILTHYMLAHDHALQFTGKTKITFFDNLRSNLKAVETLFASHPNLLPRSCHFQGVELLSSDTQIQPSAFKTDVIQGIGEANPEYRGDLRDIAIKYQSKETSATCLTRELVERDPVLFQAQLRDMIEDIHQASRRRRYPGLFTLPSSEQKQSSTGDSLSAWRPAAKR